MLDGNAALTVVPNLHALRGIRSQNGFGQHLHERIRGTPGIPTSPISARHILHIK